MLNGDASSPAADDSGVYVSYAEHQDYRLRLDGSPVWHYALSGEGAGGSTPALHGGSVYTRGDPWNDYPIILSRASGKLTGAFAADSEPASAGTSMYTLQDGTSSPYPHPAAQPLDLCRPPALTEPRAWKPPGRPTQRARADR